MAVLATTAMLVAGVSLASERVTGSHSELVNWSMMMKWSGQASKQVKTL